MIKKLGIRSEELGVIRNLNDACQTTLTTPNSSLLTPNSKGAGLLEMLLALAMFMVILPFVYNFARGRQIEIENVRIARQIRTIQSALEEYIYENRTELLAPITANVTRVRLDDLSLPPMDLDESRIQLRTIKSRDSGGRSFVQGIVIYDSPNLTPFRTRQIALATGAAAGFADGHVLYGAFGTWSMPISTVNADVRDNSILAETRTFRSGGDYIHRLPTGSIADATMQSDLFMGGHDINNIRDITAIGARFLEAADIDSIDASRMSVWHRLDWTSAIDVFGETAVSGNMSSDNRNINARDITAFGLSQFRTLVTDNMEVQNLSLSGFTVRSADGEPPILSISGTLDMSGGHIRATEAVIGFSGSVTPRLFVQRRIEDSHNPNFFWDAQSGIASLGDIILSTVPSAARQAFNRERTGTTETERIFNNLVNNNNATVSDYLRAIDAARTVVQMKYNAISSP